MGDPVWTHPQLGNGNLIRSQRVIDLAYSWHILSHGDNGLMQDPARSLPWQTPQGDNLILSDFSFRVARC